MLTSKTVGEQNGVLKIKVHIFTFFTENTVTVIYSLTIPQ